MPEDFSDKIVFKLDLHRAIAKLPSQQQKIAHLYYEKMWTMEKIGKKLHLAKSTVCYHVERLKPYLEQYFTDYWIED